MSKQIDFNKIVDVASFQAFVKTLDVIQNKLEAIVKMTSGKVKGDIQISSVKDLKEQTMQ